MARVQIPVNAFVRAGTALTTPTTGDATNNHYMTNDGRTVILVKNTNAGSTARVVTINISQTVDGQAVAAVTHSLAAGASAFYGPFDHAIYGNPVNIDVAHAELVLSAYSFAQS